MFLHLFTKSDMLSEIKEATEGYVFKLTKPRIHRPDEITPSSAWNELNMKGDFLETPSI